MTPSGPFSFFLLLPLPSAHRWPFRSISSIAAVLPGLETSPEKKTPITARANRLTELLFRSPLRHYSPIALRLSLCVRYTACDPIPAATTPPTESLLLRPLSPRRRFDDSIILTAATISRSFSLLFCFFFFASSSFALGTRKDGPRESGVRERDGEREREKSAIAYTVGTLLCNERTKKRCFGRIRRLFLCLGNSITGYFERGFGHIVVARDRLF